MGGDAIDAPVGELFGAFDVVDGPGDDGEAAAAELLDDGAGEECVAAGDTAGEGLAFGDGEEEVEFGADVDGVEEVDGGPDVVEGAEDWPGLGGGEDGWMVREVVEEVVEGLGGAVVAVFEVEEEGGGAGCGEVEELFEAEGGTGRALEVPGFDEEGEEAEAPLVASFEAAAVEPEVDFEEVGAGGDGLASGFGAVAAAVGDDEGPGVPGSEGMVRGGRHPAMVLGAGLTGCRGETGTSPAAMSSRRSSSTMR